jgi:hypothetical protein
MAHDGHADPDRVIPPGSSNPQYQKNEDGSGLSAGFQVGQVLKKDLGAWQWRQADNFRAEFRLQAQSPGAQNQNSTTVRNGLFDKVGTRRSKLVLCSPENQQGAATATNGFERALQTRHPVNAETAGQTGRQVPSQGTTFSKNCDNG